MGGGGGVGYQDRFKPIQAFLQTYQKTKQWYKRNIDKDNKALLFKFFFEKPLYLHPHYDFDKRIIIKGFQQRKGLFINHTVEIKQSSIDEASHLIPKILDKAECLSNQVFWLTEPFAWSEDMLSSYTKSHFHALGVPTNNPHVFKFANTKSIGLSQIKYALHVKNILKEQNKEIVIIDFFDFFQKKISNTPNLFVDEQHLSEKGHELAFQFMLPYFLEYLPELK